MIRFRKGLLLVLAVAVLMLFPGCRNGVPGTSEPTKVPLPTMDPVKKAIREDPANYVLFSRSTEPREVYVSIPELLEYRSQYADCNGTWYRDQLTGEDLVIYNSFLYALENRFISFTLYVEDNDRDFSHIREYLSLDSPFLEQNYSRYEHVWRQPINHIGTRVTFRMEQFTDSRWDMKLEAMEICRQIVAEIPAEYQTQQEKMEYLYDYVCQHVEYTKYEQMVDESYFYDAVCTGKSLCDGYSNMLSILFHLIGVECCEAMGQDNDGQSGHTWVVAKLDGEFYNFDPTFEDTGEVPPGQRLFFGFSDALLSSEVIEHDAVRPKCTNTSRDFHYAEMTVSSLSEWSEVEKIAELTEKRLAEGLDTTLIVVTDPMENIDSDLFFDRYNACTSRYGSIHLMGWPMGENTLIQITLT